MQVSRTTVASWLCLGIAQMVFGICPVLAQVSLGTADSFGVLGGSTVTNVGPTIVTGDLGVSPGSAITGFPPGIVTGGTIHAADAVAAQAQIDLTTAYNAAAGTACTVDLTGQDLGGLTLTPGVYCFSTTAALTGTLTLNFLGNPNAVFIFQVGSAITTASGSSVVLINNGSSCNVFWQVGSSATLGTGSSFVGNILALTSITLTTGSTIAGRALARNGAVTLDTNAISACSTGGGGCSTITVNPPILPPASVGNPYNQIVTATGGTAPYTFAVSAGALPNGLSLNPATGAITGIPSAGIANFTITAFDAFNCPGSRVYSLQIAGFGSGEAIPTLATWSALLMAMLLVGVGYAGIRRRVKID